MSLIQVDRNDFGAIADAGFYSVNLGAFQLEFYFKPSTVKKAYVFSPGWIDRKQFGHPYFQRTKWLSELDGIGISLADPCLALNAEIQIGWFVGTDKQDYSTIVARYLSELLGHHGVPAAQTVFFGSSAGGFASLVFGCLLKGSRVIAVNPQTNILRFHDVGELGKFLRTAFPGRSSSHLEKVSPERVDVVARWRHEGYVPPTKILLNMQDGWHFSHHILPLLTRLGDLPMQRDFQLSLYSDPVAGHNPPEKNDLLPVLRDPGSFLSKD